MHYNFLDSERLQGTHKNTLNPFNSKLITLTARGGLWTFLANLALCVPWHPQILADQLTLSQQRGADYVHQIILAPLNFQTFLRPWGKREREVKNSTISSIKHDPRTWFLHNLVWPENKHLSRVVFDDFDSLFVCMCVCGVTAICSLFWHPRAMQNCISYPVDYKRIESDWYRAFALMVVFWVRDASSRGSLVRNVSCLQLVRTLAKAVPQWFKMAKTRR